MSSATSEDNCACVSRSREVGIWEDGGRAVWRKWVTRTKVTQQGELQTCNSQSQDKKKHNTDYGDSFPDDQT